MTREFEFGPGEMAEAFAEMSSDDQAMFIDRVAGLMKPWIGDARDRQIGFIVDDLERYPDARQLLRDLVSALPMEWQEP